MYRGGTPRQHRLLLDLPVLTDTDKVSGGFKGPDSDPFRFIRCEVCGRPISACKCEAGTY